MVIRQANILGQQRLDVPHLRAMESSVAADFDVLAGQMLAGVQALVISGFQLITTGAIGSQASVLQLNTANGVVLHPLASDHGTIFSVPADQAIEVLTSTNASVEGSFTANQVNYIGIDLRRNADDSTADLVMFLGANTLVETPKSVPLARILHYKIVISTTDFASTPYLCPVAKITTDVNNIVTAVQDARQLMFRLGSGGSVPNPGFIYPWAAGRAENTSGNVFAGGDKQIASLKDWMDAIMTRVWELGGGEAWYSPAADRSVKMSRLPSPAVFSSTGDNFEFVGGNLHWQGLRILFSDSNEASTYYNIIADQLTNAGGLTDLTAGQCMYADIVRNSNATVTLMKGTLQTLGTPAIPGSRFIIAWCNTDGSISVRDSALPVNTAIAPATTTAVGGVKLAYTAGAPATPVVSPLNSNNAISIGTGSYTISGNNVGLTVVGGGTAAAASFTGGSSAGVGVQLAPGSGGDVAANCNSARITSVKDPTALQDVVTKHYADTLALPMAQKKNYVINGGMDYFQRGTSFTGINTAARQYTIDRWTAFSGDSSFNLSAVTDSNILDDGIRAVEFSATGTFVQPFYQQEIDRDWVVKLRGRYVAISFYVRANVAGLQGTVSLISGTGNSTDYNDWSHPYTGQANVATQVFSIPNGTTYNAVIMVCGQIPMNATELALQFLMGFPGAAFNNGNNIFLTQVMMFEVSPTETAGSLTTPPRFALSTGNLVSELSLCQAYYEKSYDVATPLGTHTYLSASMAIYTGNNIPNATSVAPELRFRTSKRIAPTVRAYSPTSGTIDNARVDGIDRGLFANTISQNSVIWDLTGSVTIGDMIGYHWTADAEI